MKVATSYTHVYECGYRRGFDLWTDLLSTYTHESELETITALSLTSTVHKSLHAKSSPACSNSRSLATASKSGDSPASRAQVLFSQPSAQNSAELSVNSLLQTVLLITFWHRSHRKHSVFIVVVQLLQPPSNGNTFTEPLSRNNLVYSPISRSLHSYGCTRYNIECSTLTFNCWLYNV
jgi:hypothetical protein